MKYKISDSKEDCIFHNGHELHRIIALENFGHVKIGDKGGYIENMNNLSQLGMSWVSDDAFVYENAWVSDNAEVTGRAIVRGNAHITGNAKVRIFALITGDAIITDYAEVTDHAIITGRVKIKGNAIIAAYAGVSNYAIVRDNAKVLAFAEVTGHAIVRGNATVTVKGRVSGDAVISEKAIVTGQAEVSGPALVIGNAVVRYTSDYMVFKNWWSSGRYFTWTRSNDMYKVGCFYGSGEDLIKKAYSDSKVSGDNYKTIVDYVNNVVKNKLNL